MTPAERNAERLVRALACLDEAGVRRHQALADLARRKANRLRARLLASVDDAEREAHANAPRR